MDIVIRRAAPNEAETILSILREAAEWLTSQGKTLWRANELRPAEIAADVEKGMYWLAETAGQTAGCVRYQHTDPEYWDDVPHEDSAFIHRVAVRRKFAGGRVSGAILDWAKQKAAGEGKKFLRLDCARRKKLCRIYEGHGFVFHSEKQREPYLVVRYEYNLENVNK